MLCIVHEKCKVTSTPWIWLRLEATLWLSLPPATHIKRISWCEHSRLLLLLLCKRVELLRLLLVRKPIHLHWLLLLLMLEKRIMWIALHHGWLLLGRLLWLELLLRLEGLLRLE